VSVAQSLWAQHSQYASALPAAVAFDLVVQVWLGAFESALQAAQRQAAAMEQGKGQDAAAVAAAAAAAAANAPRQLLERALKSLPKRKHVKALTRYDSDVFQVFAGIGFCMHITVYFLDRARA
jgi:hypothetical protein